MTKTKILIAAYCISGVIAFGYSASNIDCEENKVRIVSCSEKKAAHGILAAFWSPFYWSWVFMEGTK